MNQYLQWAIGVCAILCLGFISVAGIAASRHYQVVPPAVVPAGQEAVPGSAEKSTIFEPKISSSQFTCELRPEDQKGESRRVSYSIQSKDVAKMTEVITTLASSIEGANLALNRSSYDGAMPGNNNKYASLSGVVPAAEVQKFVDVIEKARVEGAVFVESKSDYTEPAQTVYQNCLSQLAMIQSLEIKEAVLLRQLEESASSSPEVLDQAAQGLSDVRMQYSYMVNAAGPSVFDILGRINSTFFDVYISDMKG
jgi:hypothetical protein